MHSNIDRFLAGADRLHRWLEGVSHDKLDRQVVPNTWTMRQLVLHVLDSDLAAGHRMKRIAAEPTPLLIAYDETAFAQSLYAGIDPHAAAELFRLHREHTAAILRALPEEAFSRVGIHNQRGKITLSEMIHLYVHHLDHHEPFAQAKRRAMGL